MKILLVSESYWPNADGGALFERRLALGLVNKGLEMAVIAPSKNWSRYKEKDGPYYIYRERAITFWANTKYKVSFSPFLRVRKIILLEKPDLIHIHNTYWLGISALIWGRIYKIPVVATNHFMPENALLNLRRLKPFYKPLSSLIWFGLVWVHNRCKFVTSPTPTAIQLLKDHGLNAPAKAISNGIDTSVFKPGLDTKKIIAKLGIKEHISVMLYVGRVDGEKRLDLIVSAMPIILEKNKVQLVIAGFGKSMHELKLQAANLGVSDNIIFTGYLDESDKPYLYNAATLFVISSPAELQSIVTLEAMSSGLPIVSVDVAALKELCHDNENGFLFKEDDYQELALKALKIIDSPELAKEFGDESMSIIKKNHGTDVTFNEYKAVYKEVLKMSNQQ